MKHNDRSSSSSTSVNMGKTHLYVTILVIFVLFIDTLSCSTSLRYISEKYSQKQVLMKNVVKSVRHVVKIRPTTNMPYYCALIYSPPGGKPLAMLNMLRLTQRTLVIVNMWHGSERNSTVPNRRNYSGCENIIVFASIADVHKIISNVNLNFTSAKIELLVAIYDASNSDDEAKKSAKSVVDFAWKQLRGYAIVLIPVGSRVLALKSERHVPYVRCEPESPRIMAYWENDLFLGNLSFERFGYNKCVVRISTADCWLLARLEISNGREIMTGLEIQILETIAERHNYTMEMIIVKPPINKQSGIAVSEDVISNAYRVREKLYSGKADIAACSMWVYSRENISYTISYSANYVVLMIPIPKYTPFASILQTFSKPVWICVAISWIVGRVLIRVNRRSISSLMALALFLGVSVTSKSRGFVENWQMTLWVVYGYLITQSYIASLASVLNNPWLHKIETIEELATSDIQVAGYPAETVSFEIDDKYIRIIETFIGVVEPKHTEMMNNPDKFLLNAQQTAILVDILVLNKHSWFSRYYRLKERIRNVPLGMAVMSRSRVSLSEIDRTISTLIENGLIPKWSIENLLPQGGSQRISADIEGPSPTLSLEEVAGIFVILVVGLLLSMIVFIFEVYKNKASKNGSRKMSRN